MKQDFESWKEELLFTGRIIQDDDDSVPRDEVWRRFNRYTELVEQLDGSEGPEALSALFQSIQVEHDHGAYQTAYRALGRFPEEQFIAVFVQELPGLIARQPEWAGDFLVDMANGQGGKWDYQIGMFNAAVAAAEPEVRESIVRYVRSQEPSGWLRHRVGVLCSGFPAPA